MAGEFAFVSHETAALVNRAIARGQVPLLPDAGVYMLPESSLCVTNRKKFKELARAVDLRSLGVVGCPVHLVVPEATARSNGKLVQFHVWRDTVPDGSFVRLHDRVFASSVAFALLQLALACRPSKLTNSQVSQSIAEDARARRELGFPDSPVSKAELLAWEHVKRMVRVACLLTEFAGTYSLPISGGEATEFDLHARTSRRRFEEFLAAQPMTRGVVRARRVAALAFDGSASPMETALALMLTLPLEYGGYGLPRPRLNAPIIPEGAARAVSSKGEMRADLLWQSERLVVEYDGAQFHKDAGPAKVEADAERANSLTALGYRVLGVAYGQFAQRAKLDLLARQIARLLHVSLASPTEAQATRRMRLHALLLPTVERSA